MDTGEGYMARFDDRESAEAHRDRIVDLTKRAGESPFAIPIWTVGEEVEVKGSRFRVAALGKRFVRLQLLPRVIKSSTAIIEVSPTPGP